MRVLQYSNGGIVVDEGVTVAGGIDVDEGDTVAGGIVVDEGVTVCLNEN